MNFLQAERAALARHLPGLDEALAEVPLQDLERPGSPALSLFRAHGGPGLLVPVEHGGHGAGLLEAVRVQQQVGARSPSLAVATTMHHFSVATLVEMASAPGASGMEWLALEGVARQRLYVASGFAEGRSGASIFSSTFAVRRTPDGLLLRGSKKPCSLSASMDLLTVSFVLLAQGDGPDQLVVALLPAASPGVSRRPFWGAEALAGAESDEVVLDDVVVPENLISYAGAPGKLDAVQERGFLWFELLITASYLGAASALVERVLREGRGTEAERVQLAVATEGVRAALEGVARAAEEERGPDLLARALLVRYAVQESAQRAAGAAAELLGGMAFVRGPEVGLLLASVRALAFHPPSRLAASPALDGWLRGGAFTIE